MDSKAALDALIRDLWLACYSGVEIADVVGCDEKTITNVVSGNSPELENFQKPLAEHQVDFVIPRQTIADVLAEIAELQKPPKPAVFREADRSCRICPG